MTFHPETEHPAFEKEKKSALPSTETFVVVPAIETAKRGDDIDRKKQETKPDSTNELDNIRQRIAHLQIPEAGLQRARVRRQVHDEAFGQLVNEFHQATTEDEALNAINQIQKLPQHLQFLTDMEMMSRNTDGSTSAEPGGLIDLSRNTKEKNTGNAPVIAEKGKRTWWKRLFESRTSRG